MNERLELILDRIRDTEQEMALAYRNEPCSERLDDLLNIQARISQIEAEIQAHSGQ